MKRRIEEELQAMMDECSKLLVEVSEAEFARFRELEMQIGPLDDVRYEHDIVRRFGETLARLRGAKVN